MERFPRRLDWAIDAGLAVVAVASRIPFMSRLLYDHDSFLFARAAVRYDLRAGIPHPPGYIFYVYLGRLFEPLTGDINRAFIWVQIIAGALAAICIYHLGKRVFSTSVGLMGALLYLFGPLVWFYHEIATSYAVEGFLSALAALLAWRTHRGSRLAPYLLAVVLGLGGGVRPWLILQLLPLWVFALWGLGFTRILISIALVPIVSLTWLAPNAVSAGGVTEYVSIVRNYGGGLLAEGHLGNWPRTLGAVGLMAQWWWYSLGFALVGLLWPAIRRWIVRSPGAALGQAGPGWRPFLACWILPALLLRIFVHITYPGYLLIFLPGLCLLAAAGLVVVAQDVAGFFQRRLPAASGLHFLGRPRTLLALLLLAVLGHHATAFLVARGGFSWPIIQAKNRLISERIAFVRRFPPNETVVFASEAASAAEYYLSRYRVLDVFYSPGEQVFGPHRPPAERARTIVLFDTQLLEANRSPESLQSEALPIGLPIFYFQLSPGQRVTRWKGGYRLVLGNR